MFRDYRRIVALIASATFIALLGSAGCVQSKSPAASAPSSSGQTITQEIVRLELERDPRLPQALAALDALISEELADLKRLPAPSDEVGRATELFTTFDELPIRRNFVFPPTGLVDYVSNTFVARRPTTDDIDKVQRQGSNQRRLAQIDAAFKATETFHYVDRDTGAMLYIAVAQQLGYPCHLVEIPGHKFIRWDGAMLRLGTQTTARACRRDLRSSSRLDCG